MDLHSETRLSIEEYATIPEEVIRAGLWSRLYEVVASSGVLEDCIIVTNDESTDTLTVRLSLEVMSQASFNDITSKLRLTNLHLMDYK